MSTKRKLPTKLGQPTVRQSAKVISTENIDESRTVVSGGGNATRPNTNGVKGTIDVSSEPDSAAEEGSEEGSEEEEESDEEENGVQLGAAEGIEGRDVAMREAEEEEGEPSFGDLVRANASEHIDVASAFDGASRALAYPQGIQIQPPSGASLGTVLTQALKTNDISLLESCLHTTDVNTIRATIQRLESPLAGALLQKLAERLHRRPGRAGSLMVWVQWTLVTHGGYLATQGDLIKKLAELNKVIDGRAKGLQSLLSLKGKLDMLEAQMELRKSMQKQRRVDDEDDEGVIYVEGQESEEESGVTINGEPQGRAKNGEAEDMFEAESEESEDMPMVNGVIEDSEEEDDSDDDGLIDDEAEESAADSEDGDEDEVDHDDQDSQEEEESDDAAQAPPPTKMQRLGGMFSRKR
ncbi:hypothetical protein B7494_g1600 [Chlorociboria aeruginascens]|nr:hypothetical protein B7494_g1600 [Chlorociboria aeruginascens]